MIKNEDENEIYEQVMNLKSGSEEDKLTAFKCLGILSNESTSLDLEGKLQLVREILEKHKKRK